MLRDEEAKGDGLLPELKSGKADPGKSDLECLVSIVPGKERVKGQQKSKQ